MFIDHLFNNTLYKAFTYARLKLEISHEIVIPYEMVHEVCVISKVWRRTIVENCILKGQRKK